MRAFAAVFTREIFERRFAFLVAFAAGFVPLIGSLAYGWRSPDAAEGRVLVGLVGATALSAAFALLLGAAVLVGETKEKRISFYFARPIPSGAIWAGKLLAAVFITVAAGVLSFVPAWLTGPGRSRAIFGFATDPDLTILAALGLACFAVLGSHAVVTVARLRSPWVALDLLLAPSLVLLAALFLRSLVRASFPDTFGFEGVNPAPVALTLLAASAVFALTLATFVQVAEGRTDALRAHGAFSTVFFGITGLAVAVTGGYAAWCAAAKPTDLLRISDGVQAAPRGTWVFAEAPLRAWRGGGQFLLDTAGSRSLRLRGYNVVFSQDGAHAAWQEPRLGFFGTREKRLDVFVADLETGRAAATGLETSGWSPLALSPTGRLLAAHDGTRLSVFDVSRPENPRQLAAFPATDTGQGLVFVGEDTIRSFPRIANALAKDVALAKLEITEFSVSTRKALVTGRFDREALPFLRLSPDGRYFVGSRRLRDVGNESVLALLDGRTGAHVATLASGLRGAQARFLTGNRIAVAGIGNASAQLLFFDVEKGAAGPTRTTDLGPAARVALGGEIAPGRVVVTVNPSENNDDNAAHAWRALSVEASTGARTALGDGLAPVNRFGWWFDSEMPPADAGSPAALLFLDAGKRLVRLDPATGARTVLLGEGK